MPPAESFDRLTALRQLLSKEKLSTQDELREELESRKFKVTQSTISRDLRRIGAVRAVDANGRTVYRLSDDVPTIAPPSAGLESLIRDIRHNGMMIVIITAPGSASLIARHLDQTRPAGLLGTLAGDDTIFVAPASATKITQTIRAIREGMRAPQG